MMARYIDADKFVKQFERALEHQQKYGLYNHAKLTEYVIKAIENEPTADVVEVVRCKDCIHAQNIPLGLCYLHTEPYDNAKGYKGDAVCVEPDDFCSYGQKKGE